MNRVVGVVAVVAGLLAMAGAAPPKIKRIVFERTPCYGTCPVYTLTLKADGTAIYRGTRFVERLGTYKGSFWVDDFDRLRSLIDKWGFWKMKPRYTASMTDQATQIVTVVTDQGTKKVTEYGASGPTELWTMYTMLDGIVANTKWQRLDGASPKAKTKS